MALCYQDSEDYLATADLNAAGWTYTYCTVAAVGRHSSSGFKLSGASVVSVPSLSRVVAATGATAIFGFGFLYTGTTSFAGPYILYIKEGATVHAYVGLNANGTITAYHGAGGVLGTTVKALSPNTLYDVEIKVLINDAAGTVDLKVNGEPWLALSGQDTRNGGTAAWDGFTFSGPYSSSGTHYFAVDDLYVEDGTGPAPHNDLLGDCRADVQVPITPNGTDDAWSRSAGSDNWALVDETVPNTSDYLYTSTLNAKVSLNKQALINVGGTIKGVRVVAYLTKMDAGPCGVKGYLLIGGTRYYTSEWFPSFGSYAYFDYVWPTNPAGGAWDETAFNAAEVGVERTT